MHPHNNIYITHAHVCTPTCMCEHIHAFIHEFMHSCMYTEQKKKTTLSAFHYPSHQYWVSKMGWASHSLPSWENWIRCLDNVFQDGSYSQLGISKWVWRSIESYRINPLLIWWSSSSKILPKHRIFLLPLVVLQRQRWASDDEDTMCFDTRSGGSKLGVICKCTPWRRKQPALHNILKGEIMAHIPCQ